MKRHSESSESSDNPEEKRPVLVIRAPNPDPIGHDKKFPFFRRPRVIGAFSVNGERKFVPDRSQMMFFCPERLKNGPQAGSSYKRVNWDLNDGIDKVIRKNNSFKIDEGISFMLKWILSNRAAFQIVDPNNPTNDPGPLRSLSTDFVAFRGLLTTIMCTPYEKREGWQIFAVKYKGTIYLRQMDTEAKIKADANPTENQMRMSSWGYKFEQFTLDGLRNEREDNLSENRKLPPVNENEEFCALFRARLGHHSLVYGAEMDGFRLRTPSEGPINPDDLDLNQDGHFIELKTSRTIDSPRLETSFARHKIIKWWCQSFLVCIPVVVCGFRNDFGLVNRLQDYPTAKMPQIGANFWLPNVCMNFLDAFLTFAKSTVQEELVVYRFWWEPNSSAGNEVHVVKKKSQDINIVLPNWYKDEMFKQ